ncbi:exodeoxyribonuclease VII large subunit [Filifactor villosus]|uniref:Exodeoxyribonuclease 7 large subunit n=1 Tax=Filifactor villosus TaxID=29374 RepID=A0ABV9QKJ9_9FIRM
MKVRTWTVYELNSYINRLFKSEPIIQNILLEGEISNCKIHRSGHVYFSLKDERAKVNAVMFQSDVEDTSVFEEGNHVLCRASVNLYEKEGSYNLIVRSVDYRGKGSLYPQYLELKEKLASEGLFDAKHKKKLPLLPKRVGVVTSNTGAVISDIVNVMRNRFAKGDILLYPARVQGSGAAQELIEGIEFFNREAQVDVIIVGRGGGSYEELFCFNDENLARSIFHSQIPIVSAVGHETDVTISDFVADLRASTPSMAAELVFPSKDELYFRLEQIKTSIIQDMKNRLDDRQNRLNLQLEKLYSLDPLFRLETYRQKNDHLFAQLTQIFYRKHNMRRSVLELTGKNLLDLNPFAILERGYGLVRSEEKLITSISQVKREDLLNIILSDGSIRVRVVDTEAKEAFF